MTVSVCVVAYNEEKALPMLLKDIKDQDYPHEKMEVVLVDSMSSDETRGIMERFKKDNKDFIQVQVLDNPKKHQAPGWNIAINNYTSDIIIRVDAHASIPRNFVTKNVELIEEGEYVTGGIRPNICDASTPWKDTLLLAEQSMFGSSISAFRRSEKKAYVKSLFHGAYRREVFENVGGFDEQLGRTEDNEIHYRIRQAGYKIGYSPEIISYQHVRSTLRGMMKQKYGNGYWVMLTMKACPKCLSIYHFVPFAFVLGIIFTTILALLGQPIFSVVMWGLYSIVAVLMSFVSVIGVKKHWQQLLLPFMFLLLHVSYGMGSFVGILKLPFWKYEKTMEEK